MTEVDDEFYNRIENKLENIKDNLSSIEKKLNGFFGEEND